MVELVDTSVWGRRHHPAFATWFATALVDGEIAICDMVALELLHTASSVERYQTLAEDLKALPWAKMGNREWERALEVYGEMAARGNVLHRSVKHADLLIAASAECTGMTLVHYDKDYDTVVEITGQPARWVAPRGTL